MHIKNIIKQLKDNKKYVVAPLLFFVILSMTIVCASFSQTMIIRGDAYVRVNADIRVTGVSIKTVENLAAQYADSQYSKNTSTMFVALPALNSKITYNVTVENKSNERYTIDSVSSNISNNTMKTNAEDYVNTIIEPNSTQTLEITYEYNTETLPENNKTTGTITFSFSKPTASMIQYSSQYTNCNNVQCALDELYELLDE